MKVAVLSANLGNFDTPVDPVKQTVDISFHRFTDEDFPPVKGLTPRMQYRIPKMFGWQMFPDHDVYIWLDGTFTLSRKDSAQWFLDQLGDNDFAFFKHPYRENMKEETDHIENYLARKEGTKRGQQYLIDRYENGLHKEQYADCMQDKTYIDDKLYTSTAFVYRDSEHVRDVLRLWWLHTSRYFTVDQIALPYVTKDSAVAVIDENQYKCKYLKIASHHV